MQTPETMFQSNIFDWNDEDIFAFIEEVLEVIGPLRKRMQVEINGILVPVVFYLKDYGLRDGIYRMDLPHLWFFLKYNRLLTKEEDKQYEEERKNFWEEREGYDTQGRRSAMGLLEDLPNVLSTCVFFLPCDSVWDSEEMHLIERIHTYRSLLWGKGVSIPNLQLESTLVYIDHHLSLLQQILKA